MIGDIESCNTMGVNSYVNNENKYTSGNYVVSQKAVKSLQPSRTTYKTDVKTYGHEVYITRIRLITTTLDR